MKTLQHESFFFLFSNQITKERLSWISALFVTKAIKLEFHVNLIIYLTGDALYSLIDVQTKRGWRAIKEKTNISIKIDWKEAQILGLHNSIKDWDSKSKSVVDTKRKHQIYHDNFWQDLALSITNHAVQTKFGVFSCEGPYFFRNSVYSLKMLKEVVDLDFDPEYYAYLDGIHSGHANQHPSEFENIGLGLTRLFQRSYAQGNRPRMFACSRCATARGYWNKDKVAGDIQSEEVIDNFRICNLNEIVERFKNRFPIMMVNSGISFINLDQEQTLDPPPSIFLFITHSPYHSEYAFGGLSFAMACSSHNIPTTVVFIEEGIYCLFGDQSIQESDKIFCLQDIIEVSADEISYFAYEPSIHLRGLENFPLMPEIKRLSGGDMISFKKTSSLERRFLFF